MPRSRISPEFAYRTGGLTGKKTRQHLLRLAALLEPHAALWENALLRRLERLGWDPRAASALAKLTPGAASTLISAGRPFAAFLEQVEYNGRRLAKLNVTPARAAAALATYGRRIAPLLDGRASKDGAGLHWAYDQIHFATLLMLNGTYGRVREEEAGAVLALFQDELEARGLDDLLNRLLETLVRFCGAQCGRIYLLDRKRNAWIARAASGTKPARKGVSFPAGSLRALSRNDCFHLPSGSGAIDREWNHRFQSCWSVPLVARGQLEGVAQFGFKKTWEWLPREVQMLTAAAGHCALAFEKARLVEEVAAREEQVRQLARHMIEVEEKERRRISRELHDEAGQSLLCMRLELEMIENSLPETAAPLRARVAKTREMAERTIVETRRLIAALSPLVLEELGIEGALRQLVGRFRGVFPGQVRFPKPRLGELSREVEILIYRVVQECLNNIGKHSQARAVNLSVKRADGILRIVAEDDGVGFDPTDGPGQRESFGLSGIAERVALLGGRMEVHSGARGRPGRSGARIDLAFPVSGVGTKSSGPAERGYK